MKSILELLARNVLNARSDARRGAERRKKNTEERIKSMRVLLKENIDKDCLPGRVIQRAVGKDSASESLKMTVSFARYSAASGPMEPHRHAEEVVYIIDAKDGWVRKGPGKDLLNEKVMLGKDTVLHFEELEWHVFEYGPGGYIDALCIYGQVDNIRPEDILKNSSC
ncbi:hypothetical protein [Propionivibrio sp.]|uniref:hypothetical protein n=1 Tax=Propionivibrio sp. TaxID=2212460 RepID=UPI0039E60D29